MDVGRHPVDSLFEILGSCLRFCDELIDQCLTFRLGTFPLLHQFRDDHFDFSLPVKKKADAEQGKTNQEADKA